MNNIPKKLRNHLETLPRMHVCARAGEGECSGRITWEHAHTYVGRQIQEPWAIIGLCWFHHLGDGLDKDLNRLISLRLATDDDFARYPRTNWKQLSKYLEKKYVDHA